MADVSVNRLFNVNDMVFVITGGGSGLGEMMALALDANGASKVFILGRREASLKDVASKAVNHSITPVTCDVTSKDSLQAAVKIIEGKTPFVNALIANSGALGSITSEPKRDPNSSVADIQKQFWDTTMEQSAIALNVNVLGSFYTFVAFMKLLEEGNIHPESRGKKDVIQSQFITTTSLAAFSRMENVGYPYMASKSALWHMTKSLATQFANVGIRANSISPGLYVTEMTEFATGGRDLSIPGSVPKDFIPMTRTGSKEDIAGALLFLVSRAGAFVNGNVILSDGGTTSIQPSTY